MYLKRRLSSLVKDNPLNIKLLNKFIFTFLAIILITFVTLLLFHPDFKSIFYGLNQKYHSHPSKMGKFIDIAINNCVKVPFQSLIMAFIPIPFLYFIDYALTAFSIGFIYYLPFVIKKLTLFMVLLGTIVHGIPEALGFCITCVALFRINKTICQKIYKRKKNVYFKEVFISSMKIYLIYALPILFLAAILEAFITPLLLP